MDILIVEDDQDAREVMEELLTTFGYDVAVAENGLDALNILSRGIAPKLILLDVEMPIMNGEAFMNHREKIPALAEIPVVIVSATPELLLTRTASGHVRKPFELDTLLSYVNRYCARRAA